MSAAAGMLGFMIPGVVQAQHGGSELLERSWGIQRNSAQLHDNFQKEMRYSRYGNHRDQEALLKVMCALSSESKRLSSDLQCNTSYSKLNSRVSSINRYLREVNRLSGCVQLSPCVRGYLQQTNNASSNFNRCFSSHGQYSSKSYKPVSNHRDHDRGYSNRNRDYDRDRDYRSNDRDRYEDRHRDYGRSHNDRDRDGEGFYRMRATKAQKVPSIIIDRRSRY